MLKIKIKRNFFIINKCYNLDYNPKEINKKLLYKNELNITYQELELISPKKDEFCKCYPKTIFSRMKWKKWYNR